MYLFGRKSYICCFATIYLVKRKKRDFSRSGRTKDSFFIVYYPMPLLSHLVVDAYTLQIPFIEAVDTFIYLNGVMPSETVQLAHIGEFLKCAIRL